MVKLLTFLLIMSALIIFLWHDEITVWVDNFRQQAEDEAPALINQGLDESKKWWEEKGEAWADQFVAQMTSQGKEKIDAWLEESNLNQYGDSKDTAYTGGTPLFNEQTGETVDRYVHLLKKFPDMIKDLDLGQYVK